MDVLAIQGSPRRTGNTNALLDIILNHIADSNFLCEKIHLQDMDVFPCKACNSCMKTGQCIQNDDMDEIVQMMKNSKVWILGTPVYWWSVTGQMKAFIDRWYGVDRTIFRDKSVVIVVPLESSNPKTAMHAIGMFNDIFEYLNMELFDQLIATGVHKRGEVMQREDYVNEAHRIGKNIVQYLST